MPGMGSFLQRGILRWIQCASVLMWTARSESRFDFVFGVVRSIGRPVWGRSRFTTPVFLIFIVEFVAGGGDMIAFYQWWRSFEKPFL